LFYFSDLLVFPSTQNLCVPLCGVSHPQHGRKQLAKIKIKMYIVDIQRIMQIKTSRFHSWCLLSPVLWVENTTQRLAIFLSQKEDQQRQNFSPECFDITNKKAFQNHLKGFFVE
jgi:hypothetical protein